jgi:von Willebrand factor type A domain
MKAAVTALSVLLLSLSACSAGSGGASNSTGSGSGSGAGPGSGSGGLAIGTGGTSVGVGGLDIGVGGMGGSSDVMNGECNQVNFMSSRKPVSVMLVLDRSGSMTEHEVEPGIDRWEAIQPAMTDVITATDASVHWGLKLFPEGTGEACTPETLIPDIHIPIAEMNGAAVNARILSEAATGNGTPTGEAVAAAAAYLATLGDDTQKFILLATDGDPSCPNDDDGEGIALAALSAAYDAGFPTFVVGVLGGDSTGNHDKLNAMGVAGGRPPPGSANPIADKFFLTTTRDSLIGALQAITSQVASCVFAFETAPPDPTNIAVKINGERINEDATDGWSYTSDQHLGVELHGAACQNVRDANQSSIDMIFGCPGKPIF